MYKLINKIMNKARKEKVDIGVAYAMLISEEGQNGELKEAYKFLSKNQVAIFKLKNKGLEDEIKRVCDISADKKKVWRYINGLYEKGVIER